MATISDLTERKVSGWISDGQEWRYWIIADPHGSWILTRLSASAWADGSPYEVARETVINAMRPVTDPEDARRMARHFEDGHDIDGESAWTHEN
jgi:hypothetical protein